MALINRGLNNNFSVNTRSTGLPGVGSYRNLSAHSGAMRGYERSDAASDMAAKDAIMEQLLGIKRIKGQTSRWGGMPEEDTFKQTGGGLLSGFGDLLGGGGGLSQPGSPDTGGDNPYAAGIAKMEAARRAEIDRGYDDALNTSMARLQDRGLGGSTLAMTAAQGVERNKQHSLDAMGGEIGEMEIRGIEAGFEQQEAAQRQRMAQLQQFSQLLGGFF